MENKSKQVLKEPKKGEETIEFNDNKDDNCDVYIKERLDRLKTMNGGGGDFNCIEILTKCCIGRDSYAGQFCEKILCCCLSGVQSL
jgi:hypothetical protein